MEEQLRARKLASASVRRRRMDERQRQKELLAVQREEWRKRRARYSEIYNTDSDASRSHSPENDSSFESPSEDSVPTPVSSVSPDVEFNISISDLTLERFTRKTLDTEDMVKNKTSAVEDWTLNTDFSSLTRLNASLNRASDFRYDRFSIIANSIDMPPNDEHIPSESEDNGEEDDEDDYEYSPIEVATPVAICMPTAKPNVISVADLRSRRFSVKTVDAITIKSASRASISTFSRRQVSKPQIRESSGFPAHEAEPLEVVKASSTSIVSAAPSSDDNVSIFDEAASEVNVKRKSSMPMFAKFTHARMNSIKKLIKPQSFTGQLPAVPQIPSNHQIRPLEHASSVRASTSTPSPIYLNKISGEYETFDRVSRRSTTEPLTQSRQTSTKERPQTPYRSHSNSVKMSSEVTALPVLPNDQDVPQIKRKKSFSNLRRRSGSLGQALKLANSSRSKSPLLDTAPPPPLPVPSMRTGQYAASEFGPTHTKPLRSLRSSGLLVRSSVLSGTSSHFDRHASVGLGLRI